VTGCNRWHPGCIYGYRTGPDPLPVKDSIMNLETQLRRCMLSLALVGGTLGVIVSQAESRAVEGMIAQEVAAACEAVLPAEADAVGPVRAASGRQNWRSLLPAVVIRTRH
jgi:hypothetical protein